MKNLIVLPFLLFAFFYSTSLFAQELPAPSPSGKFSQTVGLTDITVEYSRPGVKGRVIFGELLPYEKLWRTGANKATKITFDKDVKIEGKEVPAGSYSIFTIPSKTEWTFILNKDTELWGEGNYDESKDQLRVKIKPVKNEFTERLTISVDDFDDEKAVLNLAWENIRIPVNIQLSTYKQALKNIENEISSNWRAYYNAARYHLDSKTEILKALEYAEKAVVESNNNWSALYLKARIQAESGNKKDAIITAKKALEDSKVTEYYKPIIEKSIKDWESKTSGSEG